MQLTPRPRRFVRLLLAACLASSLAAAYPAAASARPPSDSFERLVDVGGHRLFVKCMGRGAPTVILESGLGNPSGVWYRVQPAVARFTTVCSYDRAGLGRSERGPVPRTSQTAVDELQALLRNAGIRGPYVLVGHSIGGFHVQLFARQDGGRDVTGAVLVDATPLDFVEVGPRFGVPVPDDNPEGLDIRTSAAEVRAAPAFPNIPLVVLTHTIPPPVFSAELERIWQDLQLEQSRLSCRGELVEAENAGHYIQLDRPDLVIAAIQRVVDAAHPNNARRLHPKGYPQPAGPQGSRGNGRWNCP